jgi:hypothetical protein
VIFVKKKEEEKKGMGMRRRGRKGWRRKGR